MIWILVLKKDNCSFPKSLHEIVIARNREIKKKTTCEIETKNPYLINKNWTTINKKHYAYVENSPLGNVVEMR